MVSTSLARTGWRTPVIVSMTFAATLVAGAPVHAQDGTADDTAVFEAIVEEARDATQAITDDVNRAIEDACDGLAYEACLQHVVAEQLPVAARETDAFADLLEGLEVPDVYADDVAAQIVAVRELADLRERIASAAEAADGTLLGELGAAEAAVLAGLAAELSPEYAGFAFLSTFGADDYVGVFGGATAEELEYFGAIRRAQGAAQPQFECFGQAINEVYGTTDALLGALYDCGAGTALAAIEDATRDLTPPERFTDAHAWLLAGRAEGSRLDGLIGQAAREGDIMAFLTNNVRLGWVLQPYPGLDAAFLSAATGAPPIRLDPTEALARSDYGRGLFAALIEYRNLNPLFAGLSVDFPQVSRDVALQAVTELAPELRALEAELRGAIEALEPPVEVAADHTLMLEFFEGRRGRLEELIGAAAVGDIDVLFTIGEAADAENCATADALSDAIAPIAVPYFDSDSPDCR